MPNPVGEGVYQTKVAGRRSGLSPRELAMEMLGTTIAHDAGLWVARPALVNLPFPVWEAIERQYEFEVTDGTAFGVVWKSDLTPFVPEVEPERLTTPECAMLLAVDLLLANGDRTEANPNVCWEGDRLLTFDFEHCLELPGRHRERRQAIHFETMAPLRAMHLISSRVEGPALRRAAERLLQGLAIDAFRRDAYSLPSSWHEPWLDIVEYLGYIKGEPAPFLDRIEVLSPF